MLKTHIFLFVALCSHVVCNAQDTLARQRLQKLPEIGNDSLFRPTADSMRSHLTGVHDRLDSVRQALELSVDSLQNQYAQNVSGLRASAAKYQGKIDSLQSINLPTKQYIAKLDSVSRKLDALPRELDDQVKQLQEKFLNKINQADFPPELQSKISELRSSIKKLTGHSLLEKTTGKFDLSSVANLESKLELDALSSKVDVLSLPVDPIGPLGDLPNEEINIDGLNGLSEMNGQMPTVTKDLEALNGNLNMNSAEQIATEQATQLKEVQVLQQSTSGLPLQTISNEGEAKEILKQQAQKVAMNHFSGKQAQITAAMEKLGKFKSKYSSVSNISELPKHLPNPMNEKPPIERLVPGLALQFQSKTGDFMIDFNPYVGFRVTEKLTSGIGWNQRVAYNFTNHSFNNYRIVYGPRSFVEYNLKKGFYPRAELEYVNAAIEEYGQTISTDPMHRQWVLGMFLGLKKEYRIAGKVKGTAMLMTRLFNPDHKSPYGDVINARIGFEIQARQKKQRN
jgi:hypothetical protein